MEKQLFKVPSLNIAFLVLSLITSGCTPSVTYVEPKTGPLARVRFVTADNGVTVYSYSSKECNGEKEMMRLINDIALNSDPRRLGMPLWDYHKNAAKEFYVTAGIPHIYMFKSGTLSGRLQTRCGAFMQQTFEEGKDYELKLTNSTRCILEAYEIRMNASGSAEKVLLQKIDNKLSPDFSKACITNFKQHR